MINGTIRDAQAQFNSLMNDIASSGVNGLQVIRWELIVGAGSHTVTVTDPILSEPSLTITTDTILKSAYVSIFQNLSGARILIAINVAAVHGLDCVKSCSLFHTNSAQYDDVNDVTSFLDFQWGVVDGSLRTVVAAPNGETWMFLVFPNAPPEGNWKFSTACLVPLSGTCP
jgi:hypothetical protein